MSFGLLLGHSPLVHAQPKPTPARLGINITNGVVAGSVLPNSAAERMGVKPFDIIYKFNGIPARDADDFARWVRTFSIDQPVSLFIVRAGKPLVLTANSTHVPDAGAPQEVQTPPAAKPATEAGLEVAPSPELFKTLIRERFENTTGVVLPPEKVIVTFQELTLGEAQPNTTTGPDGKTRRHIANAAPDADYLPFVAKVTVSETYAGGVVYEYPWNWNYEAYVTLPDKNGKSRWTITGTSPVREG